MNTFEISTSCQNIFIHGTVAPVIGISQKSGLFSASFYDDTVIANVEYGNNIQYELRLSKNQRAINNLSKTYLMSKVNINATYYANDEIELKAKREIFKTQSTLFVSLSDQVHSQNIRLEATVNLKVLMIYTKQAVTAVGSENSILATISLAIGNFNIALQNSLVDMTVTYVAERMQEYDTYVEDSSLSVILSQMGSTISTTRRIIFGCHAVQITTAHNVADNICGIGYYNANANVPPYSVVKYTCSGGVLTTAHEVGHNFGLQHDYQTSPTSGTNHGYCWDDASSVSTCHRSVMSYQVCITPKSATNGNAVKYFSNPNVIEMGNPTGNIIFANNAQQLVNNMVYFVSRIVNTTILNPKSWLAPK